MRTIFNSGRAQQLPGACQLLAVAFRLYSTGYWVFRFISLQVYGGTIPGALAIGASDRLISFARSISPALQESFGEATEGEGGKELQAGKAQLSVIQ